MFKQVKKIEVPEKKENLASVHCQRSQCRTTHKRKEGTPTMGGLIFILGSLLTIAYLIFAKKIDKNRSNYNTNSFNNMFANQPTHAVVV